jgi:hypothetical protein
MSVGPRIVNQAVRMELVGEANTGERGMRTWQVMAKAAVANPSITKKGSANISERLLITVWQLSMQRMYPRSCGV